MQRRNKIILLLLVIIILIPLAYYAYTLIEEQTFYDGIKKISDIENKSDAVGDITRNKTNPTYEEIKEFNINAVNTTSTELVMLRDLKSKLSNEDYLEYVEIQINRLNCENRTYSAMLDNSLVYEQFQNGEISSSRALSLIEDNNEVISLYANKTGQYKVDADTFLSVHTDMKDRFNKMGIDEDFLYEQIEEVKTESVI